MKGAKFLFYRLARMFERGVLREVKLPLSTNQQWTGHCVGLDRGAHPDVQSADQRNITYLQARFCFDRGGSSQ